MPLLTESRVAKLNQSVASGRIIPYLALVLLVFTLLGGVAVRFLTPGSFSSLGNAMWWSAQTMTTVGYGDVVPGTSAGRLVAVAVMFFGVATVSLLTAVVTAAFVDYQQRRLTRPEEKYEELLQTLVRIEDRLEALERRLS